MHESMNVAGDLDRECSARTFSSISLPLDLGKETAHELHIHIRRIGEAAGRMVGLELGQPNLCCVQQHMGRADHDGVRFGVPGGGSGGRGRPSDGSSGPASIQRPHDGRGHGG
jgi:hypothetical protein